MKKVKNITIEARLDKDHCLNNFKLRLLPNTPPSWKEKEKYKVSDFEVLWDRYKTSLEEQKNQIESVLLTEGTEYLEKILSIAGAQKFPFNKIRIFLVFPKLINLKPERFSAFGSWEIKNKACFVSFSLWPFKRLHDGKDIFVLWHELIHTLQPKAKGREVIREAIAELCEDIIIKKPKQEIRKRIKMLFKNLPIKKQKRLIETCLSYKPGNILELEERLIKVLSATH